MRGKHIYEAFIHLLTWTRLYDLGDFRVTLTFQNGIAADHARLAFFDDVDHRDLSLNERRPGLTGRMCGIDFEIDYPRTERAAEEFHVV